MKGPAALNHPNREGRVGEYAGNFSDTLEARTAALEAASAAAVQRPSRQAPGVDTPAAEGERPRARKLSMREKRELASLETEIETAETRCKALENLLAADSTDYALTQSRFTELETLRARLDVAMERWAELSEIPQ
ncbi:MAG: hypothetical protein EB084_16520 [Proteobacteria bacterium]|nr:hypothetical protein [Pseudomonadota bacterium]